THTDVTFLQLDVDDVSEVAQIQRITAMPTFKFFVNGKPFEKQPELVGANLPVLTKALASLSAEKITKEGESDTTPKPAAKDAAAPVEAPKKEAEAPKKDVAAPAPVPAAAKQTEDVPAPVADKAPVVTDDAPSAAPAA
ncbi:hypothetical protein GGH92_010988, partial [Coemansia sp. RSA 2673]